MSADAYHPFPGLRPYTGEEDFLFFGREHHTDELLTRLRTSRFVAVLGSSGSGKSSLVRAGLVPALQGGFMAGAGSSWRIATFRPGSAPIASLADALCEEDVLPSGDEPHEVRRAIVETMLRDSALGLLDAADQLGLPEHTNLLVVADQFEEIFRYQQLSGDRDQAIALVRLLLAATRDSKVTGRSTNRGSIYVALTMRADFLGETAELPGLSEAINDGQYLVPPLDRSELTAAITGPVAVGGGAITPRLVQRLLNDGHEQSDQLPTLQHALMRMWEHWRREGSDRPLDLSDYEAVGTLDEALSQHLDSIYAELEPSQAEIVPVLFKALTEIRRDGRDVRHPVRLAEICNQSLASVAEVTAVVDRFRRSGRCFLMPPEGTELSRDSVLDLSHEAVLRQWHRLRDWAVDERESADFYKRIAAAAEREPGDGLWRDPKLQNHLQWRKRARPTEAWALRYDRHLEGDGIDTGFGVAMDFLDRSQKARTRRRAWGLLLLAGLVSALGLVLWLSAANARQRAATARQLAITEATREEREAAEQNLELANNSLELAKEQLASQATDNEALRQRLENLDQQLTRAAASPAPDAVRDDIVTIQTSVRQYQDDLAETAKNIQQAERTLPFRSYKIDVYFDQANEARAKELSIWLERDIGVKKVVPTQRDREWLNKVDPPRSSWEIRYAQATEREAATALLAQCEEKYPNADFTLRAVPTKTSGTLSIFLFDIESLRRAR